MVRAIGLFSCRTSQLAAVHRQPDRRPKNFVSSPLVLGPASRDPKAPLNDLFRRPADKDVSNIEHTFLIIVAPDSHRRHCSTFKGVRHPSHLSAEAGDPELELA
jgi:hypothetical protein